MASRLRQGRLRWHWSLCGGGNFRGPGICAGDLVEAMLEAQRAQLALFGEDGGFGDAPFFALLEGGLGSSGANLIGWLGGGIRVLISLIFAKCAELNASFAAGSFRMTGGVGFDTGVGSPAGSSGSWSAAALAAALGAS